MNRLNPKKGETLKCVGIHPNSTLKVTVGRTYRVVALTKTSYRPDFYIFDDEGRKRKVLRTTKMFETTEDKFSERQRERTLMFVRQIEHFVQCWNQLAGNPQRDELYESDRDLAIKHFLNDVLSES